MQGLSRFPGVNRHTLYHLGDLPRKNDPALNRSPGGWSDELLGLPFRAK